MTESTLVGYVRKSQAGGALKLSIDAEAFEKAERYDTKDGRKYVQLVVNMEKVQEIISGDRKVTSLCQIQDN